MYAKVHYGIGIQTTKNDKRYDINHRNNRGINSIGSYHFPGNLQAVEKATGNSTTILFCSQF
jgi:hypothetical protein